MYKQLSQLRDKRRNDENGFTLIELLVVVVIIGILIAIAIPVYLNYRKSSNDTSAESDVRNAVTALEACNSDNGKYPTTVAADGTISGTNACSQKINHSSGTTFKYVPSTDASNYILEGQNSNGNKAVYCYASESGGAVAKVPGTVFIGSTYASACPSVAQTAAP